MTTEDPKKMWDTYRQSELAGLIPILTRLGYVLDLEQPHTGGERYLMQAVTTASGKKLILLGEHIKDRKRVVIKATSDAAGVDELTHERTCRTVLQKINFAYQTFLSPEELLFEKIEKYTISIQSFLPQACSFLDRPTPEQFEIALNAFKAQESAHATTYAHLGLITKTFGKFEAEDYLSAYKKFIGTVRTNGPEYEQVVCRLRKGEHALQENADVIEQYTGFLTHTDFVPHNFRVVGNDIYLLDYSSLRFGNKYEGWARFLNFMTLHNPELERVLTEYVRDNRTPEESVALKMMRIYRLGEIISYYTHASERSIGNLKILNEKRVIFWSDVLEAVLENRSLAEKIRTDYREARDMLRSEDEKKRQIGLH